MKELSPDDKLWDAGADEAPCCIVEEPGEADTDAGGDGEGGAPATDWDASAKQECTVQEYDHIRKMDVKF